MGMRYIDYTLGEGAKRPYKKYPGDAGWDLFVSQDCTIGPGETKDIHTNLFIDMPPFLYGRIVGRSSSLRKFNLLINEGIIDNGYTGELFVCAHNVGNIPLEIEKGTRVAQILFHPIEDVRWSEVEEIKEKAGGRGANGFGSTGR